MLDIGSTKRPATKGQRHERHHQPRTERRATHHRRSIRRRLHHAAIAKGKIESSPATNPRSFRRSHGATCAARLKCPPLQRNARPGAFLGEGDDERPRASRIARASPLVDLVGMFPDEAAAQAWVRGNPMGRRTQLPEMRKPEYQARTQRQADAYHCGDCRRYFSVKTGTVMQSSKLPFAKVGLRDIPHVYVPKRGCRA